MQAACTWEGPHDVDCHGKLIGLTTWLWVASSYRYAQAMSYCLLTTEWLNPIRSSNFGSLADDLSHSADAIPNIGREKRPSFHSQALLHLCATKPLLEGVQRSNLHGSVSALDGAYMPVKHQCDQRTAKCKMLLQRTTCARVTLSCETSSTYAQTHRVPLRALQVPICSVDRMIHG
jgi:hypothetical protein